MSALVSIIIPIYNLEDYIENCLNSVVKQTYRELEILCIDDGSTDKSAEKIKAFAERDSRVKYLYQENAGVSAARNKGLDEATGEYVMFVDGDDYIHFQAVEILLAVALKSDCDIACSLYKTVSDTDDDTKMQKISEYNFSEIDYSQMFTAGRFEQDPIGTRIWGKLYKRNIAASVKFPLEIYIAEDVFYIIKLLDKNAKVTLVTSELYYYYKRDNSTVRSAYNLKYLTHIKAFDMLSEFLVNSKNGYLKSYSLQCLYRAVFYNRTMAVKTPYEAVVFKECRDVGKKWLKTFLRDTGTAPKTKIMFLIFFFSRHIYEMARMMIDPTMLDFYKSRKKRDDGEA